MRPVPLHRGRDSNDQSNPLRSLASFTICAGIVSDRAAIALIQTSFAQTFISESAVFASKKKGTLEEKVQHLEDVFAPLTRQSMQEDVMGSIGVIYRLLAKQPLPEKGHIREELQAFEIGKKSNQVYLAFLGTDFCKHVLAAAHEANTRCRSCRFK